jgi:Glycosyltransferase family 87
MDITSITPDARGGVATGFSVSSFINTLSRSHTVVLLTIAAVLHFVLLIAQLPGRVTRFDFSVFYASAAAIRRGMNPYLVDLRQIGDPLHLEIWPLIHTTSTPTFLLCFMPFAYIPESTGYWIWFVISMTALAAAIVLMLGGAESGLPMPLKWVVADAILLYSPINDHIAFAQVQILILLMLVLVMRWLASGREVAAGLMLALAVMLRAFPLVLALYLIVTRRWRALFAMTMGLVLIAGITVAGLGSEIVRTFIDGAALTVSHHPVSLPINVALGTFVTRLFWHLFGTVLSPGLEVARKVVVICVELAILGFSVRATLRTAGGRDASLRAYGLWVVVSVILSPIAWVHYMGLFLLPFIQITFAANRGLCSRAAMWAVVASYFLIPLSIGLREPARNLGGDTLYFVVAECAFISVLLAYFVAYRFAIDNPPSERPAVAIGGDGL